MPASSVKRIPVSRTPAEVAPFALGDLLANKLRIAMSQIRAKCRFNRTIAGTKVGFGLGDKRLEIRLAGANIFHFDRRSQFAEAGQAAINTTRTQHAMRSDEHSDESQATATKQNSR